MAALIPALINAAGAIGGGILSRDRGKKLSPIQKKQNQTIDLILQAVQGEGPLAQLTQLDDNAFQRSIVDPLQNIFTNQTAPGIQQQFISNRLQGGTGLNDALARAGVDLQSSINQQFLPFQQQGQSNLISLLQSALGASPNVADPGQSAGQAGLGALSGVLSNLDVDEILESLNQDSEDDTTSNITTSTGFTGGLSRSGNREGFVR